MTEQVKRITKICGGGKCPAVYLAENGDFVIQGTKIEKGSLSGIDPASNEEVIRLPKSLVDELFHNYER